jgi:hypothetical protein
MSRTVLYLVPERGEVERHAEFRNAWLGAMNVWRQMAKHYLGWADIDMVRPDYKPIWALARREDIPLSDRTVLTSTFDHAMVRRAEIPTLIDAIKDWCQRFEPGTLLEQAAVLAELAQDERCYAVCWNQTSVCGDMWDVRDPGEEESRGYDISRDTSRHWFMFGEEETATVPSVGGTG